MQGVVGSNPAYPTILNKIGHFGFTVLAIMGDAVSVYIVAADPAEAERIAQALVQDRLAACVNILGAIRSVYLWQGTVQHADETALIAKTTADLFGPLAERVRALHSYEIPAIVAWPIVAGEAAYLDWIRLETQPALE